MNTHRVNSVMAGGLYFLGLCLGSWAAPLAAKCLPRSLLATRLPVWICGVLFTNGVGAAGNRDGPLAGHQGLQPGCSQGTG
jgi:hypothetical protein